MFGLIDGNNFYASCERIFRPDLRDKPVIMLSNNDGCAIARSNETKTLGIKMGAPAFQIADLIKENNVAVFSANFVLYGDLAKILKFTVLMRVFLIFTAMITLIYSHIVNNSGK